VLWPGIRRSVLRRYWGSRARTYYSLLSKFDKVVILLIVYASFAESFLRDGFTTVDPMYLISLVVLVVLLFYTVFGLILYLVPRVLRFNREDQITALFCGSKKSLTHGSVFAKFLFANDPRLGL